MKPEKRTPAAVVALVVSLTLNAVLGAWVLLAPNRPHPLGLRSAVLFGAPIHEPAFTPSAPATRRDSHPKPVSALVEPPFHWSQIESDDYRQYIANLRAVGCPEETIRDMVSADLGALYTPRARAIWTPKKREYWQKTQGDSPNPLQTSQLLALAKEEAGVSRALLGAGPSAQDRIDALMLQLHGSERELLFLPDEKRAAARAVLLESGLELRAEEMASQGHVSAEQDQAFFNEKLQHLAKVLSPAEVEEFRLRHSPAAQRLRSELQYFDCTPDEFKHLLDARQTAKGNAPENDLLSRDAATRQAREFFGEARAADFERVTDLHYQQARRAVDELGLPVGLADQAWTISREARRAADEVAGNTTLPVEERLRQVRVLQETADRRLHDVLGEKASRAVRRDLNVMLRGAEARLKP